jgi:hypothetical protein
MAQVPRIPLSGLGADPAAFVRAMKETGFVVLTDIGEGEKLHRDVMAEFAAFMETSDEQKKLATSKKVYMNERHVPMWYCGYEGEQMREAFRVCSGLTDIGCWPSEKFQESWTALSSFLQDLCDRCLSILLEKEIRVRANAIAPGMLGLVSSVCCHVIFCAL